jgi:transposase
VFRSKRADRITAVWFDCTLNQAFEKLGKLAAHIAAMTVAVAELPDDVDALKAMIIAMAEQRALLEARTSHLEAVNKTADERTATLTAIVRMLKRPRFGTRSERLRGATLSDEQHAFVFDEIKTGPAAIEAERESTAGDKPKRARRSRKGFAADLERSRLSSNLEIPADCEGLEKVQIGEDVSERLDVMRATFRVIGFPPVGTVLLG